MTEFKVEIVRDHERPEGGHVVIRLLGLKQPPKRPEFTIEPADASSDLSGREGWPQGELKPLGIRQIGQTVEFLVGPDVVESGPLLPGTPVIIGLPSNDVRCQTLWPSVPPLGHASETKKRASPTPPPSRAETKKILQETKELLGLPERPQRNGARTAAAGDLSNITQASDILRPSVLEKNALPIPQSALIGPTLPAADVDSSDIASKLDAHLAEAARQADKPIASTDTVTGTQEQPKPSQVGDLNWEHRPDLVPNIVKVHDAAHAEPAKAYVAHPPAEIITLEKYDEVRRNSERASRRFAALALFIALLASATSVYAVVAREGVLLSALVSRLAFGPDALSGKAGGRGDTDASTLYGTLVAGPLSPQGQKASGIDTKAALQRADDKLYASGTSTDKREAAFWLKKYLVGTIGDARTLWALTQLGTIYANPSAKAHDYDKARMLWELSASMGDSVALCFLGNLHEYGYGVRANKRAALIWYQRAKQAGGCKSLDQAITRVRQ